MLFYEKYSNLNMNMQVCEMKYKLGVATRHMVICLSFSSYPLPARSCQNKVLSSQVNMERKAEQTVFPFSISYWHLLSFL